MRISAKSKLEANWNVIAMSIVLGMYLSASSVGFLAESIRKSFLMKSSTFLLLITSKEYLE